MTLAKKIVGRKRHIAVDTDARLLMVNLAPADISDSAGVQGILEGVRKRWPLVKHLFADGAYDRLKIKDKATDLDFVVEIVRRSDDKRASRPHHASHYRFYINQLNYIRLVSQFVAGI